MADVFDIVDIVYSAVESANTGLVLVKGKAATGEKSDHITVRAVGVETKDYVSVSPVVNVNVFIKPNSNGMEKRELKKTAVRKLEASLKNIVAPAGMYWNSKIEWIEELGEAKEGFDCVNIRLKVITELN